jgi:poly-gamma-glutamate capsule biosynthesis protein CapA/YwtB (metallophosphatase superfamily)
MGLRGYVYIFIVVAITIICTAGMRQPLPAPERKSSGPIALSEEQVFPKPVDGQERIQLSFIGDIMAHDVNYLRVPSSNIYAAVQDLFKADDLTFANLEFPIDPDKPMSTYPRFNVHPAYVQAALDAGIEVFSLANNHITDQGTGSLLNTIKQMESLKSETTFVFSGITAEPGIYFKPVSIRAGRYSIGFLAITELLNEKTGAEYVYQIDYHDKESREKLLVHLDTITDDYDFFVLSVHGGVEYSREPLETKRDFFRETVLAGVDILWSHHPHVLQPYELYTVEGSRKVILYSTGNFISGQTWDLDPDNPDLEIMHAGESAVFQVALEAGGLGLEVAEINLLPISNYRHPEYGMVVRPTRDLSAAEDVPDSWRKYYTDRLTETYLDVLANWPAGVGFLKADGT